MIEKILIVTFVGGLGAVVCTLLIRVYRPKLLNYNSERYKIVFETLGLIAIWGILLLAASSPWGV